MKSHAGGFTLVELLVAISIFGFTALGAATFISTILDVHDGEDGRYELYREGFMIMERLTSSARKSTFLFIPNAHAPTRNVLAISGFFNEDNDHYFDDPLFPRIDEDPNKDMSGDGVSGVKGLDDDGDGQIDESHARDDDEDGLKDEDPFDGVDNDGDGNVDEDNENTENIAGVDDDADGSIDESGSDDSDEDGQLDEDRAMAIFYSLVDGTRNLVMGDPYGGSTMVLSSRVGGFQVTYEAPGRIIITLTMTDDDGESVTFSEYVHLENTYQKIGKRVL